MGYDEKDIQALEVYRMTLFKGPGRLLPHVRSGEHAGKKSQKSRQDGNGYIDKQELAEVMRSMGEDLDEAAETPERAS